MLDTDTKRRIDTARDILVGKVPDPKSQVEQITIALIYKFMDDMDAESEEFGGVRKFFAGDFARYGWARLMHSGLGGHETLNVYAEAITRMPENPGIPLLFRDIFKNAYLPYRDPETLRAFLKIIDEFSYDHSERLGDAFEYLLSVLGSQGDAGQFRTPRHIIDFMVEIVDPKKTETILDPACGTAGFLISSYKHILAQNRIHMDAEDGEDLIRKSSPSSASMYDSSLTPDERGRLARSITGYDISPDMVRLSLVNMYLHGFADPHIYEYDTLTSLDRWNEYADVILANPPFMSPKGGIRPHNRFSVQSKRSEVLFVDYMAEHLTPNGRAGIIVPEGIIFQNQNAYKQLRKMLVEDYLVAVVSLPAGVFQPYSGVKTSILILDRALAKRSDAIGFFKVENDGFDLGAQRREIDRNDLPQVQEGVREYFHMDGEDGEDLIRKSSLSSASSLSSPSMFESLLRRGAALIVPKAKLAANGEYNLSLERYGPDRGAVSRRWPLVELGSVSLRVTDGSHFSPESTASGYPYVTVKDLDGGRIDLDGCKRISAQSYQQLVGSGCRPKQGDVLFSKDGTVGKTALVNFDRDFVVLSSLAIITPDTRLVLPEYIYCILSSNSFVTTATDQKTGVAIRRIVLRTLKTVHIPLPPLEVQKEIVAEIEGYQKVIDGARAVVDNYRPHIPIDPAWPMGAIGDLCIVERGASPRPIQAFITESSDGVNWIKIGDAPVGAKYITQAKERITPEGAAKSRPVKPGDFVLSNSMSFGRPYIMAIEGYIHDGWLLLRDFSDTIERDFLYHILGSEIVTEQFRRAATGGVVNNLNSKLVRNVTIPLPPLATQQAIVAEIEAEQALVDGNRELIARFEKKIQATLARVWGEEDKDEA